VRRPRWRRPRPDPAVLEEARAQLEEAKAHQVEADVGWQAAVQLERASDRVHGRLSGQLLENHIGPKIHDALTGGQ